MLFFYWKIFNPIIRDRLEKEKLISKSLFSLVNPANQVREKMSNRLIVPSWETEKVEELPESLKCHLAWSDSGSLIFSPRLFGDQDDWELYDEIATNLKQRGFFGTLEHRIKGYKTMILPEPKVSGTRRRIRARK